LLQAIEAGRRVRDAETHSLRDRDRDRELGQDRASSSASPVSRAAGPAMPSGSVSPAQSPAPASSLVELKALLTRVHLPDEGLDQFLAALRQAVDQMGATHPDLLRLLLPYREYITGNDGLAPLRRKLEQIQLDLDEDSTYDEP